MVKGVAYQKAVGVGRKEGRGVTGGMGEGTGVGEGPKVAWMGTGMVVGNMVKMVRDVGGLGSNREEEDEAGMVTDEGCKGRIKDEREEGSTDF